MSLKILCVDDEIDVLNTMEETLSIKYDVFTAKSAEEGLQILEKEENISVIISDQYMDGISGIEFLKNCRENYPNAVRLLVSGYMDLVDVLPNIEYGIVNRFIKKPWSVASLYRIIDQSIVNIS
jgi:two-component system response regulator HupR/HoxA